MSKKTIIIAIVLAGVILWLWPCGKTCPVNPGSSDEAFRFNLDQLEAGSSLVLIEEDGALKGKIVSESGEAPAAVTAAPKTTKKAPEKKPAAPAASTAAASAEAPAKSSTNMGLLFFVFVLACFTGFELINKVPSQLHTPLMSGSNAISGITIVGALLSAGMDGNPAVTVVLGALAVAFAMINVVGGYMVTDRMLGMFKGKGGQQ